MKVRCLSLIFSEFIQTLITQYLVLGLLLLCVGSKKKKVFLETQRRMKQKKKRILGENLQRVWNDWNIMFFFPSIA